MNISILKDKLKAVLVASRASKSAAIQFYIQKPVILRFLVCKHIIYEIVAGEVVGHQKFHYGKVIAPGQFDERYIRQVEIVYLSGKLAVLIIPENDAARMILRQRRRKLLYQSCFYIIG